MVHSEGEEMREEDSPSWYNPQELVERHYMSARSKKQHQSQPTGGHHYRDSKWSQSESSFGKGVENKEEWLGWQENQAVLISSMPSHLILLLRR